MSYGSRLSTVTHCSVVGLSVVSAVAVLILLSTSVACWFDLRNRRHRLPSGGSLLKPSFGASKLRRKVCSRLEPGIQLQKPVDSSAPPGPEAQALARTARAASPRPPSPAHARSGRMTLSQKRQQMERAAKTFSTSSSYFEDDTQSVPEQLDRTQTSRASRRSSRTTAPSSAKSSTSSSGSSSSGSSSTQLTLSKKLK